MKNMKKKILGMLISTLLITTSISLTTMTLADWDPGDGHKMHFPQLPDIDGWDVFASTITDNADMGPVVLADDWMCSESGSVTDIHFWGSWLHGIKGNIQSFVIRIFSDIPADATNPYSMPGDVLWERTIDTWKEREFDSPQQGFYYPCCDQFIENDHQTYFQYNIIDLQDPFVQKKGTIYWLGITAFVEEGDPGSAQPHWGWKSSEDHWNDDAVWSYSTSGPFVWTDMYEPPNFQVSQTLFLLPQ